MVDHNEKIEVAKGLMDGLSVITVVGALAEILPPIASLVTIVWMLIRIYESNTVQGILKKRRETPNA
jgi:hypothetical protein